MHTHWKRTHSFIDRDNGNSLRNLLRALRQESFLLEAAWELDEQQAQKCRLKEEEEVEEEAKEGEEEEEEGEEGHRPRRRRWPVPLMRGAKLLLLAPLSGTGEEATRQEEAAEARWLPGVWEQGPGRRGGTEEEEASDEEEEEEWTPPMVDEGE